MKAKAKFIVSLFIAATTAITISAFKLSNESCAVTGKVKDKATKDVLAFVNVDLLDASGKTIANTITALKYKERLKKFRVFVSEHYGLDSIDEIIKRIIKGKMDSQLSPGIAKTKDNGSDNNNKSLNQIFFLVVLLILFSVNIFLDFISCKLSVLL